MHKPRFQGAAGYTTSLISARIGYREQTNHRFSCSPWDICNSCKLYLVFKRNEGMKHSHYRWPLCEGFSRNSRPKSLFDLAYRNEYVTRRCCSSLPPDQCCSRDCRFNIRKVVRYFTFRSTRRAREEWMSSNPC